MHYENQQHASGSGPKYRIAGLVRVRRAEVSAFCQARELSKQGVLLITGLSFAPGERIDIGFSETLTLPGTILGTCGAKVTVVFTKVIDPSRVIAAIASGRHHGRPRSERARVNLIAAIVGSAGQRTVRVLDLSIDGMRIAHDSDLRAGDEFEIVLEGGPARQATVRWVNRNMAGLSLSAAPSTEAKAN